MSRGKPRLCYISILGAPGSYDPARYHGENGGDDELVWIADLLAGVGLAEKVEFSGVHGALGEPLPEPDAADAFILGGSYHSVHDRLPWQLSHSHKFLPCFEFCDSLALGQLM